MNTVQYAKVSTRNYNDNGDEDDDDDRDSQPAKLHRNKQTHSHKSSSGELQNCFIMIRHCNFRRNRRLH